EENVWRLVAGAKNASPDKDNVDKVMNGDDEEEVAKKAVPTGSSRSLEELADEELRCVQCGAPVPDVACGRVMPCRSCGYQYPLGDCSDYAEN
ncbi:MAG: hypothetical protein J2P31_00985, partial [Blastocatellia bacterium]|nr:hypothetical protein [Blastocatellia bacterium]